MYLTCIYKIRACGNVYLVYTYTTSISYTYHSNLQVIYIYTACTAVYTQINWPDLQITLDKWATTYVPKYNLLKKKKKKKKEGAFHQLHFQPGLIGPKVGTEVVVRTYYYLPKARVTTV